MNTILSIAHITFKEGLKHRILYGVSIGILLLMTTTVLISGFFMRDISKVIIDFCLAVTTIGGLLIPFFLAVNLIAGDFEKKTVVTILARNVSRTKYILGKYVGISLITAAVMLILFGATLLTVYCGKLLYGQQYFQTFSALAIFTATLLCYLSICILNAMVLLWCCLTTTSLLATMLTLSTYLIGQSIDDVVRFVENPPIGIEISPVLLKFVQIVQYIFPNLAAFDHKLTAAHGLQVPFGQFSTLLVYAAAYSAAVLALSVYTFNRRDLC